MTRALFGLSLSVIVVIFFSLHNFATSGNSFYFTIDQGKDAVLAREVLNKRLVLKGPTTSVEGINTGFLWVYFLAIGYLPFGGHPYAGIFLMAILQATFLIILMLWLSTKIGHIKSLSIGIALLFFWRFFESSLWQFNPFPLLILSLALILLLTTFIISKRAKFYLFALVPALLGFHAEIAAATSLLLFYLLVGIWAIWKKRLPKIIFALSAFIPLVAGIIILKQLVSVFLQTRSILTSQSSGLGTFASTNFLGMAKEYFHILSQAIFPHSAIIALLLFAVVVFLFIKRKNKSPHITIFIILTAILFFVSYLFFGSNRGWRDWHTLFLYPLIYSSFLLMTFSLPKKFSIFIFLLVFTSQMLIFQKRFAVYPSPSSDKSILKNELAILDWIYNHAENNGFNAYTYTNTFYDHHYQYLFWWYGKGNFGYVPCEYSNYPLAHKHTYISNYLDYSQPTLGCDKLRFLIIESDTNAQSNSGWIDDFRSHTKLLEQTQIGEVTIEKRAVIQ